LRDDHGGNDSFVNGHPVKEQLLANGDQLRFGNTSITFFASEGTRPFQLPSSRGHELLIGKAPDPADTVIARLDFIQARGGLHSVEVVEEITIGRSRECDIFLEDLAVSRLHATIRALPDDTYELVDNRSATGTFVNGRAMARCFLHDGDVVQIGESKFTFRLSRSS
jgi:pSer/pThr/pTyr-binding forkhead associated (FHA) protein